LDSETVELELKEDNDEVEQTELATSKDNNEGLKEDNNEVVETVKDMTVAEEENVLSSNDVVSISREVVLETNDPKSDYEVEKVVPPKGIEESLVTSAYEKVKEQLNVQESSSYESAKESLQQSSNAVDSESNSVTEQDKIEESRGIENQGSIFAVTQRQQTSWKSCCGLFEILGHGDR
jgi:FtsZ-binding cell division protein ZapB